MPTRKVKGGKWIPFEYDLTLVFDKKRAPSQLPDRSFDPRTTAWWPIHKKMPATKVYRSLNWRLSEFKGVKPHPAHLPQGRKEMIEFYLDAVCNGTNTESPFIHWSLEFNGALRYLTDIIIEVDLLDLYHSGALSQHTFLDCSTEEKWKALFGNNMNTFGDDAFHMLQDAMSKSTGKWEFLTHERGNLDPMLCTVLHPKTGKRVGTLQDVLLGGGFEEFLTKNGEEVEFRPVTEEQQDT